MIKIFPFINDVLTEFENSISGIKNSIFEVIKINEEKIKKKTSKMI